MAESPVVTPSDNSFLNSFSSIWSSVVGGANDVLDIGSKWLMTNNAQAQADAQLEIARLQQQASIIQSQAAVESKQATSQAITFAVIGVVAVGGLFVLYKMVK